MRGYAPCSRELLHDVSPHRSGAQVPPSRVPNERGGGQLVEGIPRREHQKLHVAVTHLSNDNSSRPSRRVSQQERTKKQGEN